MTKSLTVRADEDLFDELEALAQKTQRSKNYLANQALRQFLGSAKLERDIPIVTSLDTLAGDFWSDDDGVDFLEFLASERKRSRETLPREIE